MQAKGVMVALVEVAFLDRLNHARPVEAKVVRVEMAATGAKPQCGF
jgi:hypothetical protein